MDPGTHFPKATTDFMQTVPGVFLAEALNRC